MKLNLIAGIAGAALMVSTCCAKDVSSATLTLATYNIHSAIPDGHSNANYVPGTADLDNIADVLTTAAADIVALEEVRNLYHIPTPHINNVSILDMPHYLSGRLKMNYCFGSTLDFLPHFPENRGYLEWGNADQWTNNGARHGEYGNAILSRYDFAGKPSILKLPRGDAKAREKGDEPRNAVRVELDKTFTDLGKVVVYVTHFQHNNGKTRKAQLTALLKAAGADAESATVFIMGDLNQDPSSGQMDISGMLKTANFHDLAAEFAAENSTKPQPTIGEGDRKLRIDYVICSRKVNVENVEVLDTDFSDHRPVVVTIGLEP